MKRVGRDFDGDIPPNKMQKTGGSNPIVRFLIPARAAGLIIGKGGENIKRLRTQYSVKLNIPDTKGIERVFNIEGPLENICNVWRDVMPKLRDVMSARLSDPRVLNGRQPMPPRRKQNQKGNGEGGGGDADEEEQDDNMIDLRLLVHHSIAGCIIGKGGERIRELRQKHQMRVIKVYQMHAPGSTDRVVQLVAEPESAIQCMQAIVEVVESTQTRGPSEPYDAANCSEADALTYGGWLTPEALQAMMQGGGPMPQGPPGSVANRYPVGGNPGMAMPPRSFGGPPPPPPPGTFFNGRNQFPPQVQQLRAPPQQQQQQPIQQFASPPRGYPPRQAPQQWPAPGGYCVDSGYGNMSSATYGVPPPQPQQQQQPVMLGGFGNQAGLYGAQQQDAGSYNMPPPQATAGALPQQQASATMYRLNTGANPVGSGLLGPQQQAVVPAPLGPNGNSAGGLYGYPPMGAAMTGAPPPATGPYPPPSAPW